MLATPCADVCTAGGVTTRVVSSIPVTVTVAPTITAPVASTTVTCSVPTVVCAADGAPATSRSAATTATIHDRIGLTSRLKAPRVYPCIDAEPVECRLFRRLGAGCAANPKRELMAVDIPMIGEIHPLFDSWRRRGRRSAATHGCRRRLPAQHQGQVRLAVDEQACHEVGRSGDVEDVGLPLRGLRLPCIHKDQRKALDGRGEHPE